MISVRAPATTANLGPGFDCAGAALDLWNELEVTEGDGHDPRHLGVRAFALLERPHGYAFRFTDRIPRERGLGSSASVIALGLVAAAKVRGEQLDPERLLALAMNLEPHPDNLAPCFSGGVCLTWDGRIARIAGRLPCEPVAVVPEQRTRTSEARAALPAAIPHVDATYTVARAALLGAGAASNDAELFTAALTDRLHEPFRPSAILDAVRWDPPNGAAGATLSGSGPTVIVWATDPEACAGELEERFPETRVLRLRVTSQGAG
jgi:homoserine kinase